MQRLTQSLLQTIIALVQEAGEHLKRFYAGSVNVTIKPDSTPVTEADLFISQFLTERLQQLTPNVPVLSEENCNIPLAERSKWQEYWIIDPLDGTQQFIDRTDQFSVVVGLVQKQGEQYRPMLGVIHSPILGKTYVAMEGFGAYLIEQGQWQRLTPMSGKKVTESHRLNVAVGVSSQPKIRAAVLPPYSVEFTHCGSSSLKAGLVAEGAVDAYVRLGDTGEWDTAVAEVLLRETGGRIFDLHFQPLTYNQRDTFVNPHFVMAADGNLDWQAIFDFHRSAQK